MVVFGEGVVVVGNLGGMLDRGASMKKRLGGEKEEVRFLEIGEQTWRLGSPGFL